MNVVHHMSQWRMYDQVLLELSNWDPAHLPQIMADVDMSQIAQGPYLRDHFESWRQQAQLVAVDGDCLILRDCSEVLDPEN
jgi:hypothetical protein